MSSITVRWPGNVRIQFGNCNSRRFYFWPSQNLCRPVEIQDMSITSEMMMMTMPMTVATGTICVGPQEDQL